MKKILAVIPARGGSKRIPKKNIKEFCGKPIIGYSVDTALECGLFDEVMVSTDSQEIADMAVKMGARVPFMRSDNNSGDSATTEDVLLEVIEEYKKEGKSFDYICCIYPTAPFIIKSDLIKAVEEMEKYNPSQVIPLVQFSYPPQRCFIIDENGEARFKYPEYVTTRSQDLEKQYHDVGQFYVYNVQKLIEKRGIIVDDFRAILIPEHRAQDIDTLEDWKNAELKYRMIMENGEL